MTAMITRLGQLLSFTYPSRVFLIETRVGSELGFEVDRAMEFAAGGLRAELRGE
jgi:hypothetical protein